MMVLQGDRWDIEDGYIRTPISEGRLSLSLSTFRGRLLDRRIEVCDGKSECSHGSLSEHHIPCTVSARTNIYPRAHCIGPSLCFYWSVVSSASTGRTSETSVFVRGSDQRRDDLRSNLVLMVSVSLQLIGEINPSLTVVNASRLEI